VNIAESSGGMINIIDMIMEITDQIRMLSSDALLKVLKEVMIKKT